ncbi:winged helix-turn-helix transcriptional regulator [Candidatus Woesearchaeota archaeon]|nr:winged helix-turn-helix transcriptional regulator [Candidatus Woesearchaeota archaeon]
MAEDSYLLVNLKDEESKQLAQVISNDTSRKILDFLAKGEATETDIAASLNLPLSTVHYNLQHLNKAKLVQVDEYHYSKKGKEINHYKLSNKLIIIAPTGIDRVKDKLKTFLPITVLAGIAAGIIHLANNSLFAAKSALVSETAPRLMKAEIVDMVQEEALGAAPTAAFVPPAHPQISIALWFLFGAIFVILMFLLWEFLRKKR